MHWISPGGAPDLWSYYRCVLRKDQLCYVPLMSISRRQGCNPDASRTEVKLTTPAVDDLRALSRRDPQLAKAALRQLLRVERNPIAGRPLTSPLTGFRRVPFHRRDFRVIWRVYHLQDADGLTNVVEIWAIGRRSHDEVYREMQSRVGNLPSSPDTYPLEAFLAFAEGLAAAGGKPKVASETKPPPDVRDELRRLGLPDTVVDRMTIDEASETLDRLRRRQ